MKKWLMIVFAAVLALGTACGSETIPTPVEPVQGTLTQQPEAPKLPELPELPEVPAEPVPQEPEASDDQKTEAQLPEPAPETPSEPLIEPKNFTAASALPADARGMKRIDDHLSLSSRVTALLEYGEENSRIVLFDICDKAVLAEVEVPGNRGELFPMENPGEERILLYHDGIKFRKLSVDGAGAFQLQEYIGEEVWQMGEHTVTQNGLDILVDDKVVLDSNGGTVAYQLQAVLDADRLLYRSFQTNSWQESWAIYHYSTGETKPVTGMGQTVCGRWGDTLLLCRMAEHGSFDFSRVSLEDGSVTPLVLGHETAETAVSIAVCDRLGESLCLTWDTEDVRHVEVFDAETGESRYEWEVPISYGFTFDPMPGGELLAGSNQGGELLLWQVRY